MKGALAFYQSTVGKKVVVAVTGIALFLFLIGHMAGNLKAFAGFAGEAGPHKLDLYADFLRGFGAIALGHGGALWVARIGLLACLVLHVLAVIDLTARNTASRSEPYGMSRYNSASVPARIMLVTGVVVLFFIVFHILHFTTGTLHFDGFRHGRVYANVHAAFQHGYLLTIYVVAMGAIAFHLYHGVWSLFQTLGLITPECNAGYRCVAKIAAIVLFLGFSAVPVAVYLGVLPNPLP